jgi:uncharacterized membrane protein
MAENTTARAADLVPVGSRISWGAIFAGAMVALALYFLLTLLGAAVGLSVSGHVRPEHIGTGAALWAIASTLLSLFVGGFVTSQCTVGENKGETVMYGVILWGVLFGVLLCLTATGVRSGFHAMVGLANAGEAAARATTAEGWEVAARRAGVPQETVDEWRRKAEDPQNQEAVADATTRVTWWAFLGALLSMIASVAGAYVGAGPTLRLMTQPVFGTRVERREPAGRL